MMQLSTLSKKSLLVALLSSLSLTACISDENHQVIHHNPDGNDGTSAGFLGSVKVVTFDVQSADDKKVDAIIQSNIAIKTGQASYTDTAIVGKAASTDSQPKSTMYALTDYFDFVIKPDMKLSELYVPKSDLAYYYDWHDQKNGTSIRHRFDYQGVDIAHISGVEKTASMGVNTLLNNLPKTKQHKFDFPKGAKCYTLNQSISKPYFAFNSSDVTSFTTLADWQQAMSTTSNMDKFVTEQVGNGNTSRAIYYNQPIKPVTDNSTASYQYPAVVQYNGKIYNAIYNKAYDIKPNNDPDKGLVECQAYNQLAADYISQQLAKYYR